MTKNFTLCLLLVLLTHIGWSQTTYTTSGTYTVPANVFSLVVECWGAGGSGGGVTAKTSSSGGGSGGGYVRGIVWVTPGATYTVTVGAPGTISNGNGGNGNPSWFSSNTTILAVGGNGALGTAVINTAGTGAVAPGSGNIGGNIVSFYGGNGANAPTNLVSGGGGGSAGPASNGNAGNGINGGAAVSGGGAGANGSTSNSAGAAGFAPGGGGAGAANPTGGDNKPGGAGARGQVVIATCTNYVLNGTTVSSPICNSTAATVSLSAAAGSLPIGTYTVTYDVGAPNAATGLTATMSVTTAGSGSFTTAALPNAGSSAITITNLATPVSGCNNGITANNTATVVVNATTAINTQPSPLTQTICRNATATVLSAGASGASLTYQWYRNTANSNSGGTLISGATAGTYMPPTTTAGTLFYYVVVGGSCGTVTSNTAAVVVNETTSITSQPAPATQTLCQNASATALAVGAIGTNLTYQWYSNNTNSNTGGTLLSGATANTYTPVTTTAGTLYYYAVVSGSCGTVTSATSTVVVNATTVITSQPAPATQTVCQNATAAALSVSATGTSLTFQWYRNTANSTSGGTLITGATASTYTPVTTTAGTLYYYVIVTGTCGTATSVTATVTVSAATVITAQPSATGQTLCQNTSAAAFSVTATGTNLGYQWYSNTANSNTGGTLIPGATAASYLPPTGTAGTSYYYVVVSGNCAPATVTSAVSGAITVTPTTAIGTSPASGTYCQNEVAPALTVSATGTGTLSYQWYRNTINGTSGGTAVGTNAPSYVPPTSAAGTLYYYVTVTGSCNAVTSAIATITVNANTVITSQPAPATQTLCQNASATALTVNATGTGTLSFQWYRNTANSNTGGTLLSGATASTYTPVTTTAGTLYYYAVVSGSCGTVTSATSTVVVNATTVITSQPAPATQTVCQNATATALSVSATGTSLTFQWYRNTANSTSGGTLLTGATASTYTPVTTTAGTLYYYVVVSGTCGTATSGTSAVLVNATTAISSQPSPISQSLCPNAASTISVSAIGANLSYQWYRNSTNSNSGGTLLSGATAATYTPETSSTGTLYYYAIVSGTCGVVTSNTATVTVNASTVITAQPSSALQEICQNGAPTPLTVTASGTGPFSYQWFSNAVNSTSGGTSINGASSATYTPATAAAGTLYYYVTVTGTCGSATSTTGGVTVYQKSVNPTSATASAGTICTGAGTVLSLNGGGGGVNAVIRWYTNTCGGTVVGTGNNLLVKPTVTTTYFGRYEDGTPCNTASSCASVTITVNALPAVAPITGPKYVAEGRTIQLQNSTVGGTWSIDATTYATISSNTANPVTVRGVSAAGTPVVTYTVTDNATQCINTATTTISVYNAALAHFLTNQHGVYSNAAIWNINRGDGNGEVLAGDVPGNDDNITVRHNLLLDQRYNGNTNAAFQITGRMQFGSFVPGTLTILPNQSFSSAGGVDFGGNQVVVKSDATGTGAIGLISNSGAGIANATNVTVERFIGSTDFPDGRRAWRLLTAPVTGVTINNAWQEGLVRDTNRPLTGDLRYGTLITGRSQRTSANAFANGYDFWDVIATKSTSILRYKPAPVTGTWDTLPAPGLNNLSINAYPAFMLFVRGNRSVLDTGYSTTTLRATGTLNQGKHTISIAGSKTHAFTLVGNPYAAPIDFESIYQNSGTTGILHQFNIWNSKLGTYGAYQLVNGSGGEYTVVPFSFTDTVQQGSNARFIPAGTGFFVQPVDSINSGTLVIDETAKATTQTAVVNPFRGTRAKDKQLYINLNLKNTDGSVRMADGVLIGYNDFYSIGIDANDVPKQTNFYENLSIASKGVNLIMEAKPASFRYDTTQLRLWNISRRAYQFQVKPVGFDTIGVYEGWVEDRYLNTKHNIRMDGSITTIDFLVNTEPASYREDRFFVVLQNNPVVLPVTIVGVHAAVKDGGVQLNWTVTNEKNVVHYIVERSNDGGKNYSPVAEVAAGNATANYVAFDAVPKPGNNLYRVQWVDKEGKQAYSGVILVTIQRATDVAQLAVYPNPVTAGIVNLQCTNFAPGSYHLQLYTGKGQLVLEQQITVAAANLQHQQSLQLDRMLAAGSYSLRITNGSGYVIAGTNIIIAN